MTAIENYKPSVDPINFPVRETRPPTELVSPVHCLYLRVDGYRK